MRGEILNFPLVNSLVQTTATKLPFFLISKVIIFDFLFALGPRRGLQLKEVECWMMRRRRRMVFQF